MRSDRVIDPEGAELVTLAEVVDFSGLRVLEIGCGDGRLTRRYEARAVSVLGVDPDDEAIAAARKASRRKRVRFAVGDATSLEVPPSAFDLVFFSWSL